MIKVGIIGCGKQADAHASIINELQYCKIVGTCDREELLAKQLYERYDAKYYFSDAIKMIEATHPDIIHIITPPHSHLELGKFCLESGCNVFFEKPFTLNTTEAQKLINLANDNKLKLTVGHNNQFSHVARDMSE